MFRSAWLALALVALGLWASLVPQATYTAASSGRPSGQIMVAWPGWGVQQDLGSLQGTVGRFRIWVSAEPGGDRVTVLASLVDASTREVLRQATINASPDFVSVAQTIDFPSYVVPSGQRLQLQLQAAEFEENYVIYQLAPKVSNLANVAVNGVPDVANEPIAFELLQSGSGFRAATAGDVSSRVRLALALPVLILAAVMHPRIRIRYQRIQGSIRQRAVAICSRIDSPGSSASAHRATRTEDLLQAPWYPWLTAAAPILHFLASNPLHFVASEVAVPLVIALGVVTGIVIGMWLILKDWHRSAAATTAVVAVVFAYGHIDRAFHGAIDSQVLFPAAVVSAVAAVIAIARSGQLTARFARFLNLSSAILLVFPIVLLIDDVPSWFERMRTGSPQSAVDLAAHLSVGEPTRASNERPDIYYIILDEYARQDALGEFDNAEFLQNLERRGFYVARDATSNYMWSLQSLAASLNMSYLDELDDRAPSSKEDLVSLNRFPALASILKGVGYTYVHLESGFVGTREAPLADTFVSFRPGKTIVSRGAQSCQGLQIILVVFLWLETSLEDSSEPLHCNQLLVSCSFPMRISLTTGGRLT